MSASKWLTFDEFVDVASSSGELASRRFTALMRLSLGTTFTTTCVVHPIPSRIDALRTSSAPA